jgi:hypothetical protein
MRKVVVQQFVTLDGFAAGPNGELDFVTETGATADPTSGPFVEAQLAFIESLDTILLGAVTYRMFAEYWPEQTTETQHIADALNATPKVVFSSTLERAPWGSWEPARVFEGQFALEDVEGIGVLMVNVRGGYLFARCVPRVGDRDFLARDEDADLTLLAPEDRLPAADWDDHLRVPG